jgi:hypothetical protein
MPIAYLIRTPGPQGGQPLHVYHLHLAGAPYSLCGNATEGPKWRSIADLAAFLNTPEGKFVRTKRVCAICAALQKPYLDVEAANARVDTTP